MIDITQLTTVIANQIHFLHYPPSAAPVLYDSILLDIENSSLMGYELVSEFNRNDASNIVTGKFFQYVVFPGNKVAIINKFF